MDFDDLKDPEYQEQLRGSMTQKEILALIREEGIELSNEELGQISGGAWNSPADPAPACPFCGETQVHCVSQSMAAAAAETGATWECEVCGETWMH